MAKGEKTGGRAAGVPNKATGAAREAIATFVDGNAERLVGWLDMIAADNPKAAFDCFMSVVEYHIPKLARQELAGEVKVSYSRSSILSEIDGRSTSLPSFEE